MRVHGRDDELTALDGLAQRVLDGEPGAAVVEADGGIGKSALVGAALSRWEALGIDVQRVDIGRAGTVDGLLMEAGSVDEPSALLPLDSVGPGPRTNAVLDAIDARAARRPLAIVVEDLHWADPAIARDLDGVAQRLGGRAVLLVVTTRPTPRSPEGDALVDGLIRRGALHLTLAPLDAQAVHAMAADRLQARPGPLLGHLLDGAGGNPLLVDEALRTLDIEDALRRDGDVVDVVSGQSLPPLRLAVLRRSSLVSDDVIEVLRMAAVLGPRFRAQDLVVLTGRSARDLAPVLIEISRTGLVVDEGDHLAFRHDLVHDALYRDIPQPVRTALHRDAAVQLHATGRPPAQVAEHLMAAAPIEDHEAVELVRRTCRALLDGSPSIARRVAGAATGGSDRADIATMAALAAANLGDVDAARVEAEAVLDLDPEPATTIAAHDVLVTVDVMLGSMPAAVAELERACAVAGATADDLLRRRALLAYYRIWSFDLAGARRDALALLAPDAMADVTARASRECEARAHEVLALVDLAEGRADTALDHARRAHAELARPSVAGRGDALVHQALALALLDNDRLTDAIGAATDGLRAAEGTALMGPQVFYATSASMMHVVRGDLDDADALARTAITILGAAPRSPVAGLPHAVLGRIALYRGDVEAATAAMAHAASGFAAAGPVLGGLAFLTWNGEVLHGAGRHAEASGVLSLAWQLGTPARYLIVWRSLAVALARLHRDAPLPDAIVDDLVSAVDEGAARSPLIASAQAARLRVRGLVAGDVGLVVEAADALRTTERPLELAECLLDACRLAGTDHQVAWVDEATEIARARGAQGIIDALERLGTANRPKKPTRVPRPTFGWDSLTPTELLVAELTAEGLTNPQIGEQLGISRRTAETHLSHVFVKLGITNRAQLAAEMGRRRA